MLRRALVVGLAIAVFAAVAAISAPVATVVLVVGVILVLPGLAYLDAVNVPADSWNSAGRSRAGWTTSFFIIPLGISFVATAAYWIWLRRRLPGGPLKPGERVEITTGLHAGQEVTLANRSMLGLGGLWKATVGQVDGRTTTVQVSSSTVRRPGGLAVTEPAPDGAVPPSPLPPRQPGSIKLRLAGLGLVVVACGAAVVAIGLGVERGLGTFVVVLGVAAIALGLFQTFYVLARFNERRRLPEPLRRSQSAVGELVSLELRDRRRITATGVLPGGYVLPRRTDPPFDAADVEAVVPASTEEIEQERRRQAGLT